MPTQQQELILREVPESIPVPQSVDKRQKKNL
jgi:hypothetical protein